MAARPDSPNGILPDVEPAAAGWSKKITQQTKHGAVRLYCNDILAPNGTGQIPVTNIWCNDVRVQLVVRVVAHPQSYLSRAPLLTVPHRSLQEHGSIVMANGASSTRSPTWIRSWLQTTCKTLDPVTGAGSVTWTILKV